MLRDIYLYGRLEEQFGHHHRLDVDSVAETVRALCCLQEDFAAALKVGSYQIVRGEIDGDDYLGLGSVNLTLGRAPIHIVPVVEGSKAGGTKGIVTAVLGVALIATAVVLSGGTAAGLAGTISMPMGLGSVTYGQIALMGGLLALGGIHQLTAQQVKVDQYDRDEQPQSFLFNGTFNRTEQGGCVPVVYGKFEVGSIVVSAGIDAKQIKGGSDIGETHTITVSYGSGGTVSPSGAVLVEHMGTLTIKFRPNQFYVVSQVIVDSVSVSFSQEGYTFGHVTQDHTIQVSFALAATSVHSITTWSTVGGSVTPYGTTLVNHGQNLTVQIAPSEGYQLVSVLIDEVPLNAPLPNSYTFSNVTADHSLRAFFSKLG